VVDKYSSNNNNE